MHISLPTTRLKRYSQGCHDVIDNFITRYSQDRHDAIDNFNIEHDDGTSRIDKIRVKNTKYYFSYQ